MKDPKSEIINRAIIFYVVMAICGIVVIWSIISIQVYQKDELLEKANKRDGHSDAAIPNLRLPH